MAEIEARWHHLPDGFHGARKLIKVHIQAAASIARAPLSHRLVATKTAAPGEGTTVLVITPGGAQLADFFGIQPRDGTPWLWHAGELISYHCIIFIAYHCVA